MAYRNLAKASKRLSGPTAPRKRHGLVVEQQRDGPRRFRRIEAVEVERAGPLRRVERREVGRYSVRGEGRRGFFCQGGSF